jgi:hypothetical protein
MAQPIQHLVVLMLENRSFDHMLGFMRSPSCPINGLTGDERNPRDPAHIDPTQEVKVSSDAGLSLAMIRGTTSRTSIFSSLIILPDPRRAPFQTVDLSSAILSRHTSHPRLPTPS